MSFRATTHWLMIAGIMIFTAWGSRTMFITWDLRMPMAYAASAWPFGHGVDAGAEHLGEHGAVVERQRDDHAPVAGALDAQAAEDA